MVVCGLIHSEIPSSEEASCGEISTDPIICIFAVEQRFNYQ